MTKDFIQSFFFCFLLLCTITFSSEQYDAKVINFLNSLKNIQPASQNFPGYVYKISSKENEGLTSILFGTEHNSQSFCNISELVTLADIFYFESTVPKKYIVPAEAVEALEKLLDTKIRRAAEKEGKTVKFLDNMVGIEFWDEILALVTKRNENLKVSHIDDEDYCNYLFEKINLSKIVATMDEIEMAAYPYYDLETALKSDEMKSKLSCKKFIQIENDYDEIAINQRNQKWMKIEELIQDLKTKNVLIAVGYAHLLGHGGSPEFGLIELLKKENFEVEPVSLADLRLTPVSSVNEKAYYDQIQKTQNKIIDFCRPVFHAKKAHKCIKSITLKDLQGDWFTSFGDGVLFTVKGNTVIIQGREGTAMPDIEETDENFLFASLTLSKESNTLTWDNGETSMFWYKTPAESDILVQVHGLKNNTKYNEKFGIVTKLMYGEKNQFGVLMDGDYEPIALKKENLSFVQNIPELDDLTIQMENSLLK